MNVNDSRSYFYGDKKRTTVFPSLRRNIEPRSYRPREILGFSMDEKDYRMTSNNILKGMIKQNDSEIRKLRRTFMKPNQEEQSKKKVGQYIIIREVGKGGFAVVYEVLSEKGKKYALKEYNLQAAVECFQHEVKVGEHFFEKGEVRKEFQNHEGSGHLIRFVDKFKIGKFGYIVQEMAEHNMSKMVNDIQGIFHNNERIYEVRFKDFYRQLASHSNLKTVMLELCRAVSLLSQQGFIHCDLKL